MEKISYALGLSLGNNLMENGVTTLNYDKVAQGIKDILEGNKPEISFSEAQSTLQQFFRDLQAQANSKHIEAGKQFLADNAKRPEVTTTASGLQYEIIRQGDGKKPAASDTVKVHYEGTLTDGTVFDSSIRRGEPATFGVTQVIAGWVEALQLMPIGSKWKLYIPYNLAYGEHGAGSSIPPYSTLIFEVELLDII